MEYHITLKSGSRVVNVHDGLLYALKRFKGSLNQMLTALNKHLHLNIIRNQLALCLLYTSSLFAPDQDKVRLIGRRYGGYWRYTNMVDFCYLVNCYYPPRKLLDEMKANFDSLMCQYPSGMYVNSLLAARNFSLRQEQIVVGNGAAELIKSLTERMSCLLYTSRCV